MLLWTAEGEAVPDLESLTGTEVQGWSLSRVIGRGADGIVYACTREGEEAAIKLFFPESLAANGLESARERLELQLGLIDHDHHPNLVRVFAGGEDERLATLFIVMELVQGTSLDKLVGKLPTAAIVPLAGQLASAARHLERIGLVHRDIKPANIVISDDFTKLTLLDLGIVLQMPFQDDQGRLSGMEFVATVRYSPPEFVWRKEEHDADGAWRAVTLYQIGATLHDMIMRKPLFAGYDTPRACLYDAVRDRTPDVRSTEVPAWLIQAVQACLLKDWRQRLQFVSWDNFVEPTLPSDVQQRERKIRLKQARNEEMRQAAARNVPKAVGPTREQQLWNLNAALILEVRAYLVDATIFPKCRVKEDGIGSREYVTHIAFERDSSRDFTKDVVFVIGVSVDPQIEEATKLIFNATADGAVIGSSAWTEMFTVESAFGACQRAFLDAIETMTAD